MFNRATASWGDYDNDGDLDALLSGPGSGSSSTPVTTIYRNNLINQLELNSNKTPLAPSGLSSITDLSNVTLLWSTVKGDETPEKTMSYNVRFKNVDSLHWQAASHTLESTNTRQILGLGNGQLRTFSYFRNLKDGDYQWQVQAIDQGMKASEWSDTATFIIRNTQAKFIADEQCWGDTTHFTNQSSAALGIKSYKWTFEGNKISTKPNPVYVFANSGNQIVTLEISDNSGYSTSITDTIFVKHSVIADFNVISQCDQNFAAIENLSTLSDNTSADYSWKWNFGDQTTSNSFDPVTHQYKLDGAYQIKLIASLNSCADTITKNVIIAKTPNTNLTLEYGTNSFCKGDSVVYSVPDSTGYNYQWQRDGSNIENTTNRLNVQDLSGDYKVIVTNKLSENCKATSDTKTITINTKPTQPEIEVTSASANICQGDSVTISTAVNGLIYNWYPEGIAPSTSNKAIVKNSGNYRLVTYNGLCHSDTSSTIVVSVKPTPNLPQINSGATTFCQGNSVTFSTDAINGLFYQWQNGEGDIPDATTNKLTASLSGKYALKVKNSYQCYVKTTPITVVVNELPDKPVISAASGNTFCQGDSVILSADNIDGYSLQWLRDGAPINGATENYYKARTTGVYNLEVTNTSECSEISNGIIVTVNPKPDLPSVTYGETTVCQGNAVVFNVDNNTNYTYQWKNNDGDIEGATLNHYNASTSNSYWLKISNSNLCSVNTSPVQVTIKTCTRNSCN